MTAAGLGLAVASNHTGRNAAAMLSVNVNSGARTRRNGGAPGRAASCASVIEKPAVPQGIAGLKTA